MSYHAVFGPPAPLGDTPPPAPAAPPSPIGGLVIVGGLAAAVALFLWIRDRKPSRPRKPRRPSKASARRAARRLRGYIGNAKSRRAESWTVYLVHDDSGKRVTKRVRAGSMESAIVKAKAEFDGPVSVEEVVSSR